MRAKKKFTLAYASVTGKAESIAELILNEAESRDFEVDFRCLSEFGEICHKRHLVLVTSTTGDGEQPENAAKFWRKIKKKHLKSDHFSGLKFTILGLGDSNYSQFCNGPKSLHARLKELGAECFYEPGWADDGIGLELVVEPWIERLWTALEAQQQQDTANPSNGDAKCKILDTETSSGGEKLSPKLDTKISPEENVCPKLDTKISTEGENSSPKSDTNKSSGGEKVNPELDTKISSEGEKVSLKLATKMSTGVEKVSEKLGELSIESKNKKYFGISFPDDLASISCPTCPISYLEVKKVEGRTKNDRNPPNFAKFPLSQGEIFHSKITDFCGMTPKGDESVKRAYKVTLEWDPDLGVASPEPGDALGLVCPNPSDEVSALISKLNLSPNDFIEVILKNEKKKMPEFLRITNPINVLELFQWHLDIRSAPKKPFLRVLAESTSDEEEKRFLLHLCSKNGASDYLNLFRSKYVSILDLLSGLPSCRPDVERLLEHLPRLQPRPYSCASFNGANKTDLVFNVTEFEGGKKKGVATGFLERAFLDNRLSDLKIPTFLRSNAKFRLPENARDRHLIMIGPGTGVAPFRGFLQKLKAAEKCGNSNEKWLFFGCRHKDKDFHFRTELEAFAEEGVLSRLFACFSRDEDEAECKRVQDLIRREKEAFIELLEDEKTVLYVCGDAKGMAKDVNECIVESYSKVLNIDAKEARGKVAQLSLSGRYLQDVWT